MKKDDDYWAMTAIHESAHGMVALALDCHPITLNLFRRAKFGAAGDCVAIYTQDLYGVFANVFSKNAPFAASQYEALPCAELFDIHERNDAYHKLRECGFDQEMFRKYVDEPLITFFADTNIQAATLVFARKLFASNHVSIKQIGRWKRELNINDDPCEQLQSAVLRAMQP